MRPTALLAACVAAALAAIPGQASACTPLPDRLREIGAALDEVRLDEAAEAARLADQELACQTEVVSNLSLISLYQLAGAVQMFLGDAGAAELEFGRAIAISPTARLDAGLGADAEALYEQVRGRALAVPGGLVTVEPVVQAWVDGRRLEENRPMDLAAGQHLVQVERGGELVGATFRLGPGETRSINAEGSAVLSSGSSSSTTLPTTSAGGGTTSSAGTIDGGSRAGPRWGLVAAGGVGLAAGAVSLVVASGSQSEFETTDSYDDLAALKVRTNALAVTGYTLVGVGAGLGVVGFVDGGYGLGASWRW